MSIVVENISFISDKSKLIGRLYRPAPEGVYPAIAVCLAYPGDIKNMDLAEELAFNNIVTLIFYYQGAWGSGGIYRFTNLTINTRDAVAYLRTLPFVNLERIGLMSHSMGNLALTKSLSDDRTLKTGIMIAPITDVGIYVMGNALETAIPSFIESGRGKLKGLTDEQLKMDLIEIFKTNNPVELISKVSAPLLFVVGSEDDVTPPDLCKYLYDKAREPKKWILIEGADHGFSEHRIQLIKAVLEWLKISL